MSRTAAFFFRKADGGGTAQFADGETRAVFVPVPAEAHRDRRTCAKFKALLR
jgi:hypothetical protein